MWPFSQYFRRRSYQKLWSWHEVRILWPLSILLLGFPRIDKGCPLASSTLLMSVGHVPSSCCCYPQMNHSVPMTLWERGAIATSISVNHICQLRTHVLSSSLPMKSLQAAPKGFVRWTFSLPGIWHWATASSGMYGYRWLFAIVSNKMKMIKPQTWCKMKNSIWTIVPNILIYCMHFCTFNLRYIWNKVNLRPLHCFFLNSYLCPASFLLCCFAILINPTNVTLYCDIKDTNCSQGAN